MQITSPFISTRPLLAWVYARQVFSRGVSVVVGQTAMFLTTAGENNVHYAAISQSNPSFKRAARPAYFVGGRPQWAPSSAELNESRRRGGMHGADRRVA